VLGTTYRGCDLLGELAENVSRLNVDNEDRKNRVEELLTDDELKKKSRTSLRRSLSLVMLSELVTPLATCDSEISESKVSHCAANVTKNMLPNFRSHSKQQCSVDSDGRQQLSSDVSSGDGSFAEIPPLSQRLQLNQVQSEFATTDSVSGRGLAVHKLPLSDNIASSRRDQLENCCLKQTSQRTVNSDSSVFATTDSVSGRGLAGHKLPLSDNVASSRRDQLENCCLKQTSQRTVNSDSSVFATTDCVSGRGLAVHKLPLSDNIASSRRDQLENCCLKQTSERTVNSDSSVLPSRRRRALMLRTASLLSDDDVFVCDSVKPGANQQKACSASSTEIEKIMSKDDNGSQSCKDRDVLQFSRLDTKNKESGSENDFVQKFHSALHVTDKEETLEPVSMSARSLLEVGQTPDEFVDADNVSADNVASSIDRLITKSTNVSADECSEQLTWSPRHCGNFCIESSIIDTPIADFRGHLENGLQVDEFSLSDIDSLSSGSRTSFCPVITGDGASTCIDKSTISNNNKTDVSDLLFDDPIAPAEKSVLPLNVSENHCHISITDNVDSGCNDGDYSVIIID